MSAYLDLAENRARRHIPMTMEDWSKRLDIFLQADDREVLKDAGRITAEIARDHALSEFEKYRIIQDRLFESDFDRYLREMEAAEAAMNNRKDPDDRCDRRILLMPGHLHRTSL
ncbi:virulence RhuM family protein [Methanosarcinaceae archaeon]|nr:virulence RhuM family protein [Methanosarcinaceae archaeon]